jgi:hypothetical protein
MIRLSWPLLGLVPLGIAVACGGGDSHPHSGGTGGSTDGGVESGSTGGGTGGKTGGTGGKGTPIPVDTKAPAFDGATGVDVTLAEDRVRVSWTAASDDHSPVSRIAYRVYRASKSGGQDFAGTRRCADPDPDAGPLEQADLPCFVTSGSGATNVVVRDVVPAHAFYFVARAVDEAGNEDANTTEVTAETDDTTGPEFGGVRAVSVVSAKALRINWGPGYDLATADAALTFKVFVSPKTNPDPAKDDPAYTSKPGEHEAVVDGLDPLTTYKVLVRAVDQSGNQDENERVLGATTPEGVPPTFAGVTRALEQGLVSGKGRVRIFWPPATDNITDVANIVYDVYQATRSFQQRFDKPTYTSAQGVSSLLVEGLEPGTKYYYVVRARDAGGNEDDNLAQVEVTTRPIDQTAPVFSGLSAVSSLTPTSLRLTWPQANDAVTLASDGFTYLVYLSDKTPVDTSVTPFLVLRGPTGGAGAIVATVGGLTAGTAYHAVVLAKDQAGNVSKVVVEQTGTTLATDASDVTAPVFAASPPTVTLNNTTTRLNVSWAAATDASGAANIRYLVCASMVQTDCQDADFYRHVVAVSDFGVLTLVAPSLNSRTAYFVYVRAEDRAGNVETGSHFVLQATATSFATDVLPILSARCTACHDFTRTANIVGKASLLNVPCAADPNNGCFLSYAEPGKPEQSAIYRKINPPNLKTAPFSDAVPNEYSGLQEPRDTVDKLSGAEDDAIRTWIAQGAISN